MTTRLVLDKQTLDLKRQ